MQTNPWRANQQIQRTSQAERETDRQIHRDTERERETDRQTDRQTESKSNEVIYRKKWRE